MRRFLSQGVLRYSHIEGYGYKLIVEADPELARYARALIPKAWTMRLPRYDPHISVVRKEIPPNLAFWGAHEGEVVSFEYDPQVLDDARYYWIRVWSPRLIAIRIELGLPSSRRSVNAEPAFHITIANKKELNELPLR